MADSDKQASKQPPWHQAQDLEQGSFGDWLRQQREARDIELREIADHTKIGIRYLEALEKDRFDVLPAPVFTKGFLSQYGRYIGLDPDQVVNTYLNALQEGDPNRTEETLIGGGTRSRGLLMTLVVLVVVLLAAAAYYTIWKKRGNDALEGERLPMTAPTVLAAPSLPQPSPSPEETPVVAPLVVTLDFVDDGWLETSVDGERQLSEQVGKGESRRILGQELVVLSLGNAAGVRVEVNGVPYDLRPTEGVVGVEEFEINLATANQLVRGDGP